MIADGIPENELLQLYPDLERDDIRAALRYATEGSARFAPIRHL